MLHKTQWLQRPGSLAAHQLGLVGPRDLGYPIVLQRRRRRPGRREEYAAIPRPLVRTLLIGVYGKGTPILPLSVALVSSLGSV